MSITPQQKLHSRRIKHTAHSRNLTNFSYWIGDPVTHGLVPLGCLYQLLVKLWRANCVRLFLTLHSVKSDQNLPQ